MACANLNVRDRVARDNLDVRARVARASLRFCSSDLYPLLSEETRPISTLFGLVVKDYYGL